MKNWEIMAVLEGRQEDGGKLKPLRPAVAEQKDARRLAL